MNGPPSGQWLHDPRRERHPFRRAGSAQAAGRRARHRAPGGGARQRVRDPPRALRARDPQGVRARRRRRQAGPVPGALRRPHGQALRRGAPPGAPRAGRDRGLDRLLDQLMRVLLENTGAERGLLLLPRAGELAVAASLRVGEGEPALGYSAAVATYVERTREPLVVDDAAADPRFAGTFGAASGPRSLLCAPLLDRGELVGLVYLENNLATGAFTPDRLQVTSLLGAQAALSINNALLYATLARKVEERTAELRERSKP
ncbi:GAF domain-containing protein [Sorangium sp. So ce1000]|uniref:GAF domain-containing protein n=1 Tax=Sorangium sp. So ce1000 TaxID=3133325 RepID=UPI003F5E59B9